MYLHIQLFHDPSQFYPGLNIIRKLLCHLPQVVLSVGKWSQSSRFKVQTIYCFLYQLTHSVMKRSQEACESELAPNWVQLPQSHPLAIYPTHMWLSVTQLWYCEPGYNWLTAQLPTNL